MKGLPLELKTLIFSFLDVRELRAIRLVCREWLEVVADSRVVFWRGSVDSQVLGWFSHQGLIVRGVVSIRGHEALRTLAYHEVRASSLHYHIYNEKDRSFFFKEWLSSSDADTYIHLEVTDEEVAKAERAKNRVALFSLGISGFHMDVSMYLVEWASRNPSRSIFLNRASILAYRDRTLFHISGINISPSFYSLLFTIRALKPRIIYTSNVLPLDFNGSYPPPVVETIGPGQREISFLLSFCRGELYDHENNSRTSIAS